MNLEIRPKFNIRKPTQHSSEQSMPQRLQDWYRYLAQQMHVSLHTSLVEGPPDTTPRYRQDPSVLRELPRNGTVRSGPSPAPSSLSMRPVAPRVGPSSLSLHGAAVPPGRVAEPRSPDPRRRGGRRPITESREEIIRRLLDPELSLYEAAAVLNLSKATVRRYTDQGKLLCLRTHGGQRRFHLSTLLAFLDRQAARGDD